MLPILDRSLFEYPRPRSLWPQRLRTLAAIALVVPVSLGVLEFLTPAQNPSPHGVVAAAALSLAEPPHTAIADAIVPATTTTPTVTQLTPAVQEPLVVDQAIAEPTPLPVTNTVTRAEFEASIASLRTDLLSIIANSLPKAYTFSGPALTTPVSTATFSYSQKIDQLSGTSLSNITVSGVTGLTDADIPDGITANNYLPLSGGILTGSTTLSTTTISNLIVSQGPYIDVRAYGAVGDGITDDTTAIQAAINAVTSSTRTLFFPAGEYKITSTLQINTRGLRLLGVGQGRPSQTGGSRLNFYGTGALIQLGTDDGQPYAQSAFDGVQGLTLNDIALHYAGSATTALSNGVASFGSSTYGIRDWRGGDVHLGRVTVENFQYGFWGVQSDIDIFEDINFFYNQVGVYFGPHSDQSTITRMYTIFNDTSIWIDSTRETRVRDSQFVGDGSATVPFIKITSQYSTSVDDVIFSGNLFEHFQGAASVETFVSLGVGDTVTSKNIRFHETMLRTRDQLSAQPVQYFFKIGTADNVQIDGLSGYPENLVALINFVGTTSPSVSVTAVTGQPTNYVNNGTGTPHVSIFLSGGGRAPSILNADGTYGQLKLGYDATHYGNFISKSNGDFLIQSSSGQLYFQNYSSSNYTAIGSNGQFIQNSTNNSYFSGAGNVGIGTTTPWRKLSVTGNVGFDGLTGSTGAGSLCLSANNEVVYNSASDSCLSSTRATKHDINPLLLDALAQVVALQPVSFIYNNDASSTVRYGFIAEDTAAVDSHLATYDAQGAISGIDDRSIISIAVKAIQELMARVQGFADRFATSELTFVRGEGDILSTRELTTEKLCIGSTCVDEAQLQALLVNVGNAGGSPAPVEEDDAIDTEAPTITISGNNPALISVGDTYNDLGATVTDNVDVNLGYRIFVGETPIEQAHIDTSEPNEWHIHYVATDNAGNTATSTRTVIVEAPSIVPSDAPVEEPEGEVTEELGPEEEPIAS